MSHDEQLSFTDDDGEPGELLALDEEDGIGLGPVDELALFDPAAAVRRDVWHGLVHAIVSNRSLWDTVDVADVKGVMGEALAAVPDLPLHLQPLWDHMVAARTPIEAAKDTMVFFASRAERWRVVIVLPRELRDMHPTERKLRIARVEERGGTTGTFVGKAPVEIKLRRGRSRLRPPSLRVVAITKQIVRILALVVPMVVLAVLGVGVLTNLGHQREIEEALAAACDPVDVGHGAAACWLTEHGLEHLERSIGVAQATADRYEVEVVLVDARGAVVATASPQTTTIGFMLGI